MKYEWTRRGFAVKIGAESDPGIEEEFGPTMQWAKRSMTDASLLPWLQLSLGPEPPGHSGTMQVAGLQRRYTTCATT